ncbi:MAG TPA: hypothetical protein VE912_09185, partial [Bacteroidales bacterium]|nr:hypothetical protein [Bacteroidales bacterium]
MKTTIHQLTHVLSLYLNFKSTLYTIISWILIIALLNMFSGCMYYFKVKTILPPTPKDFAHIENLNKNIIIHMDDEAWELALPSLKEDSLEGYIIKKYVSTYNKPVKTKGSNRYKNRIEDNETYLLNEVHLYITEMTVFNGSKILIPLSKIERMELYEKDEAATVGSWTLGIISGTSAAAFLLIIIALATKESCPFIYTFNGNSYQFTGEIYSGSVQPRLERDDYLKLPLYDINNPEYKLKISNEVKEIQHTNLMELWVID